MCSYKIIGVEVLVCWVYFKCGIILLGEFLFVVEKIGFVVILGEIVLDKVFVVVRIWIDRGFDFGCIFVNVFLEYLFFG